MSDEMLMHFSSNSNCSDPALPNKLAKLEARMASRSSSFASAWPPSSTPSLAIVTEVLMPGKTSGAFNELPDEPSFLSDSDDDDVGEEYLIKANVNKNPKLQDGELGPRACSEWPCDRNVSEKIISVKWDMDDATTYSHYQTSKQGIFVDNQCKISNPQVREIKSVKVRSRGNISPWKEVHKSKVEIIFTFKNPFFQRTMKPYNLSPINGYLLIPNHFGSDNLPKVNGLVVLRNSEGKKWVVNYSIQNEVFKKGWVAFAHEQNLLLE